MRQLAAFFGLGMGLVTVAPATWATPLTFAYTATVTSVTESGSTVVTAALPVGTVLTGQFVFDTATTAEPDNDPEIAVYKHTGPPYGQTVQGGGLQLDSTLLTIVIVNDDAQSPTPDQYRAGGNIDTLTGLPVGYAASGVSADVELKDADGTALSNTSLPSTPPLLDLFEQRELILLGYVMTPGGGEADFDVRAHLDTLVVPEPGAVVLFAACAASLVPSRRNRMRRPTRR